jgi:hypothetical protein
MIKDQLIAEIPPGPPLKKGRIAGKNLLS